MSGPGATLAITGYRGLFVMMTIEWPIKLQRNYTGSFRPSSLRVCFPRRRSIVGCPLRGQVECIMREKETLEKRALHLPVLMRLRLESLNF